jgi:hypothetical protein
MTPYVNHFPQSAQKFWQEIGRSLSLDHDLKHKLSIPTGLSFRVGLGLSTPQCQLIVRKLRKTRSVFACTFNDNAILPLRTTNKPGRNFNLLLLNTSM